MTKVKLINFKFKPGKKKVWPDWPKELQNRKEEVIDTLKNEGVVSDLMFTKLKAILVVYK